jgi:hypothetical protein
MKRYIEVKPDKLGLDDYYISVYSQFDSLIGSENYSFLVVDKADIYQSPLLDNYEFLYQYRKNITFDLEKMFYIASFFSKKISLNELYKNINKEVTLKELYTWIAYGGLYFDISSEKLSMTTEVKFNVREFIHRGYDS